MSFKPIFIAIFVFISTTSLAQTSFKTKLTDKHQKAGNIDVYLILPDNFKQVRPSVFADASSAAIISVENLKLPYIGIIEGFQKELYAEKGLELTGKETFTINDHPATLVTLKDGSSINSYRFVLDYGNYITLSITARYREDKKGNLPEQLRKCILSVYFEEQF